jgi:dTMP kinase
VSVFIALEGSDGSGKTTQARRLVAWMQARGRDVVACRDPGSTPLGERIRQILMDRDSVAIGLNAEMLLFMASRAQLVQELIQPALRSGRDVVSDRFLISNLVYQGYAGGLDVESVRRVGAVAVSGTMPDLTILLDVTAEAARQRIGAGRDRIEDRGELYRLAVRSGYLLEAKAWPGPLVVLDASDDEESVHARIRREVADVLGIDPGA